MSRSSDGNYSRKIRTSGITGSEGNTLNNLLRKRNTHYLETKIMKKVHLLYILPVLVLALSINSCGKKSPDPAPVTDNNNNNNNGTDSCEAMMCLPANVSKFFLPTGIWNDGDLPAALGIAFSTGEYENSDVEFTYTVGNAKWGGLNFLNDNNWDAKIRIEPGATHATFDYKVPAGVTVKFTPLPDDGGTETTLATATDWTSQSIALPATYSDSITLAGAISYASASAAGTQYVFNIRNVKFIKQ
jgi:hypothetical protein